MVKQLKLLVIPPEILLHLCTGEYAVIANEIPSDTKLVSIQADEEEIRLVLEHASFPEVDLRTPLSLLTTPTIQALE